MPVYDFHLQNSSGPTGDLAGRELASDDLAVWEAATAAGQVLLSEFSESRSRPHAIVTVRHDGELVATARADGVIERLDGGSA